MVLWPLATWAAASALRGRNASSARPGGLQVIPKTDVPLPPDYEDYSRGRTPLRLFPGVAPGVRRGTVFTGIGTPAFDAEHPEASAERFIDASPNDIVGHRCAPGGDAAGHYFYNVWVPELIPYVVDKTDPNRADAAVIIAPGGGLLHLAWEPEGISPAEWLNSIGISAFVLKYRIPGQQDLALQDLQRAMRLVRSQAASYGLNTSRIGVMGSSAGGRLALAFQNTNANLYEPIDPSDKLDFKPNFLLLLYAGAGPLTERAAAAFPPTFMAYSANDPCCIPSDSRALRKVLESSMRSPFVVEEYPEGKHGWGDCEYYPSLKGLAVCTWRHAAGGFLAKHVLSK